jgi:hypothetical protein
MAERASRHCRRPSSRIKCVYNDNGVSGLKLKFFGVEFFGGVRYPGYHRGVSVTTLLENPPILFCWLKYKTLFKYRNFPGTPPMEMAAPPRESPLSLVRMRRQRQQRRQW